MPSPVTCAAHLGLAPTASRNFSTVLTSDICWLDPFPALPRRAVYSIFGGKFGKFAVPRLLEARIEQRVDVFERDMILGTTPWWHVLWIRDGELEDALETRTTHGVAALQLRRLGCRYVSHANNTFDAAER